MRAYIDESFGSLGNGRAYVVAAACVRDQNLARVKQHLRDINPHHGKLHWHKERQSGRLEILTRMSRLSADYYVVVRNSRDERSERQRRLCLQVLMSQLKALGVREATLESRGRAGDGRDRAALNWQMAAGIAPATIRHLHGSEEPALWLADFVCGATWANLNGNMAYVAIMAQMRISATTMPE